MTERICYEFDEFRLDPVRRTLLQNDEPRSLTGRSFDLLLVLLENPGQTVGKTELIRKVWGDNTIVTDNNFNVTLNAARRALGESGRQHRYIIRVSDGYRFVADVHEVHVRENRQVPWKIENISRHNEWDLRQRADLTSDVQSRGPLTGKQDCVLELSDPASFEETRETAQVGVRDARGPKAHVAHVLISCSLYAALYTVAVVLEVAYQYDRFSGMVFKIAPFVFGWMTITSFAGLAADRRLTSQGSASGLAVSAVTFLFAAGILFAALTRFLPPFPITQSALQAYPAQAAYLKDMIYFLVLGFCFLIVPFHFIVTVERDLARGRHDQVLGLLTGNKLSASPRGTTYPRSWALASLLVVLAAFSLVMTSRLLDHLKPAPYTNLFTQLVYVRGFLYFALGIWCLIWYYQAIDEIKRLTRLRSN